MNNQDYETNKRFYNAVRKVLPNASVMGHIGNNGLCGGLYFIYIPPDKEELRQKLTEMFGELNVPEVIEMLASRIQGRLPSSQTIDCFDLISRVREKILFELLPEVQAEFLWPLYELAKSLLRELENTNEPYRAFQLLDMVGPLLPSVWDNSKFDHRGNKVLVKKQLRDGVLTKEIVKKKGRPRNAAAFWQNLKSARERLLAEGQSITLENVAQVWGIAPRTLTDHCKRYCPAEDKQHFKKAMALCDG